MRQGLSSPSERGGLQLGRAPDVAVLIPCYNEERSISKVVRDFRAALPSATIYVYDNNSSDRTTGEAQLAGATVRRERRQGKGFVVRRMFADVEADIYVMVDGDDTYDASRAAELVSILTEQQLDMVNASRLPVDGEQAYRFGHLFGNRMLTACVRTIFGTGFSDMLSGYRVFSRRFVKSFPVTSSGFEIETELTVHTLELELPFAEVQTRFKERQIGSESKLNTISDGFLIIWMIVKLTKRERPVLLFGGTSLVFMLIAAVLLAPIIVTYLDTGLVPRFPTLFLAISLLVSALLSLACGLILDTVTCGRREMKRLAYLAHRREEGHAGEQHEQ
jgi:glycosyltransferase involved in cell wall biosynthesis